MHLNVFILFFQDAVLYHHTQQHIFRMILVFEIQDATILLLAIIFLI